MCWGAERTEDQVDWLPEVGSWASGAPSPVLRGPRQPPPDCTQTPGRAAESATQAPFWESAAAQAQGPACWRWYPGRAVYKGDGHLRRSHRSQDQVPAGGKRSAPNTWLILLWRDSTVWSKAAGVGSGRLKGAKVRKCICHTFRDEEGACWASARSLGGEGWEVRCAFLTLGSSPT